MKEHGVQTIQTRFERLLAIRFPEELRVTKTRRDDTLGVLRDQSLVLGLRVDDGKEGFLDRARLRQYRKPVLMMHERRRQHFLRQHEERGIEEAGDDRRELDEIGDLFDERGVILDVHAAAKAAGVHLQVAGDAIAALGVIEDHEMLGQPRLVFVEAADLDRPAGAAAGREEAVPVGQGA